MNQIKTGKFLKEMRQQEGITQEEFAEFLGVSNRSVSRWENGVNLPELDLLIEISKHFNVSMEELLDGERKSESMDKKTEGTLLKVADYNNEEKKIFSKRLCILFCIAFIALTVYLILESQGLTEIELYDTIASCMLGFVAGIIIVGILYTSGKLMKIKAFKQRLLRRKK